MHATYPVPRHWTERTRTGRTEEHEVLQEDEGEMQGESYHVRSKIIRITLSPPMSGAGADRLISNEVVKLSQTGGFPSRLTLERVLLEADRMMSPEDLIFCNIGFSTRRACAGPSRWMLLQLWMCRADLGHLKWWYSWIFYALIGQCALSISSLETPMN